MKKWGATLREEGFLRDPVYSEAFDLVNRADFLPEDSKKYSDKDEPIPIPFHQTQSAPHMNAIFIDHGQPRKDRDVLEIGTGSGYLTVILSYLSRRVISVEYTRELLKWSSKNIAKYERKNIDLIVGNINKICLNKEFDLIISTASFRTEPRFLTGLLKQGGTVIYPLGSFPPQRLIRVRDGKKEKIGWVAFVNIAD